MRRLKDLDVHEISLVNRGANRRRYLVVKSDGPGAAPMADAPTTTAQELMAAFAKIPKDKLEAVASIAKSARMKVAKDDGEVTTEELSDQAQNALKAAFRILAPFSEQIGSDTMADFTDALGVASDEDTADEDAVDEVAEAAADDVADSVGKADEDEDKKDEDEDVSKATDDADEVAQKADEPPKEEAEDDVPPQITKAEGMPDFADAAQDDVDAAMDAARTAYAEAMKQRGKQETAAKADDTAEDKDEDEDKDKDAVEKSAFARDLTREQRRLLEPVMKAHIDRLSALEKQNRELVAKSAQFETEMRRREFIAKAAREYSALGKPEEIGENMLRLHQKDPEGLEAWERIMKAANAQAKEGGVSGMFQELGTAMSPALTSSDAQDRLTQAVDARVQKSAGGRSREQIEAEFLRTPEGRALYGQAQRSR